MRDELREAVGWVEQRLYVMKHSVYQQDIQTTIRVNAEKDALNTALSALREALRRREGCERCLHFPPDDGMNDDSLYCFSCGRQIIKRRKTERREEA